MSDIEITGRGAAVIGLVVAAFSGALVGLVVGWAIGAAS